MSETVLLVHAAATWFMVGLIWFVQIVHYPLFARVGVDAWIQYEARHQSRTTVVVLPVMLLELVTAAAIAFGAAGAAVPGITAWIGAALLAVVWLSTFGLQVPLHARLGSAHAPPTIRALVATNWIRTIAWSARGIVALMMLV